MSKPAPNASEVSASEPFNLLDGISDQEVENDFLSATWYERMVPSIILLLESIRSLHLMASGIHHPLQDFAEEFIESEEIDKEMIDIGELLE